MAAKAVTRAEPTEKFGMMTTPTSGVNSIRRVSAEMRSADQPEVPTSTLSPASTACCTTFWLTAGWVKSTTSSAASMSLSGLADDSEATNSKSGDSLMRREISVPMVPVAPTTATVVVIRPIYQAAPATKPDQYG